MFCNSAYKIPIKCHNLSIEQQGWFINTQTHSVIFFAATHRFFVNLYKKLFLLEGNLDYFDPAKCPRNVNEIWGLYGALPRKNTESHPILKDNKTTEGDSKVYINTISILKTSVQFKLRTAKSTLYLRVVKADSISLKALTLVQKVELGIRRSLSPKPLSPLRNYFWQ